MHGFLTSASVLVLATAQQQLFSISTSPMTASGTSAYVAPMAPTVQAMGSAPYYFQPAVPAPAAERGQPGQSFSVYGAAAFVASAQVAMLAVKAGSRGRKAPAKKAAATFEGRVVPPPPGASWPGKSSELTTAGELVVGLVSGPFRLVKAFFSEENWVIQAYRLLAGLPAANTEEQIKKKGKATNNRR
jgi:hypothetical protein